MIEQLMNMLAGTDEIMERCSEECGYCMMEPFVEDHASNCPIPRLDVARKQAHQMIASHKPAQDQPTLVDVAKWLNHKADETQSGELGELVDWFCEEFNLERVT